MHLSVAVVCTLYGVICACRGIMRKEEGGGRSGIGERIEGGKEGQEEEGGRRGDGSKRERGEGRE